MWFHSTWLPLPLWNVLSIQAPLGMLNLHQCMFKTCFSFDINQCSPSTLYLLSLLCPYICIVTSPWVMIGCFDSKLHMVYPDFKKKNLQEKNGGFSSESRDAEKGKQVNVSCVWSSKECECVIFRLHMTENANEGQEHLTSVWKDLLRKLFVIKGLK